jgi:hypothetical protein
MSGKVPHIASDESIAPPTQHGSAQSVRERKAPESSGFGGDPARFVVYLAVFAFNLATFGVLLPSRLERPRVADRQSLRVGPDSSHRSILTRPSDEPTGITPRHRLGRLTV